MKKLLIIPLLLSLIIFSLYHEDVDGMDNPQKAKANIVAEIQLEEEILKIYNNSKNELNIRLESNVSNETNESVDKSFSVTIKGDVNTTKETTVTLIAEVKNSSNLNACNYFWYENKKIIDIGATLQKSFDKGEHNLTVVVKDANGTEINSSVMLRAYNYKSTRTLHYDRHYGQLLYTSRSILNHKGEYVLYDNGTFSKELMIYDDNDKLIERFKEYYLYPEENKKTVYTYDENGNRLLSQTFNSEGVSINYMLYVYDDNSSVINIKFGTSADDVEEEEVSSPIYYEENLSNSIEYVEIKIPKDIVEMNDNGKIVYEERYYGDEKMVNRMTYNEENKLVKSHRSTNSSYDSTSTTIEYDEKENEVSTERKYEVKGENSCHYRSENTFTDAGQVESEVSTLLGGICPYINEMKKIFAYDKEGNVISVKASTDNDDEAHTTLKVIKTYVNEFEF